MTLSQTALDCARRGWHVFPCVPRGKRPAIAGGFHNASVDQTQIREWWKRWPDANVGIAVAASGLCVVDVDKGIADEAALRGWLATKGVPATMIVRSGRRQSFGAHVYFKGDGLRSVPWEDGDVKGDFRCGSGYVLAAGSVHESGELYEILDVVAQEIVVIEFCSGDRGLVFDSGMSSMPVVLVVEG